MSERGELSLQALEKWEKRVSQHRQLIADLKRTGRHTTKAEADLKRDQAFLDQIRNHRNTMQDMMAPTPWDQGHAFRRGGSAEQSPPVKPRREPG
jgi:hypothetical protein